LEAAVPADTRIEKRIINRMPNGIAFVELLPLFAVAEGASLIGCSTFLGVFLAGLGSGVDRSPGHADGGAGAPLGFQSPKEDEIKVPECLEKVPSDFLPVAPLIRQAGFRDDSGDVSAPLDGLV
jgi:hypothetical protein